MAATTAGPGLEKAMRPILEAAGPLPHGRHDATSAGSSQSSRRKKQHAPQIRCACAECGYTLHAKVNGSTWPGHFVQSTVKRK